MIPSFDFVVCGMSASAFSFEDDEESSWSLFDFGKDTLCWRVADESVETIFRPTTAEDSATRETYLQQHMATWDPPLYRDKSLTSAPSRDEVNIDRNQTDSIIRNSDPTKSPHRPNVIPNDPHSPGAPSHQSTCDPNIENTLPKEFIPPRHTFSRSFDIREAGSSLMDNCLDSTPSPLLKQADSSASRVAGPSSISRTIELQPNDVICGRGSPSCIHAGNVAFKRVIKKHEMEYMCSKRSDKPKIALKLLEEFRQNGMRFVKREREQDRGRFVWVEIDDKQAYEKICQSLREGAPHLRREMLANQACRRANSIGSNSSHNIMNDSHRQGSELYEREHLLVPSGKKGLFEVPSQTITRTAGIPRDARDDRNYSMRYLAMDHEGMPSCRT